MKYNGTLTLFDIDGTLVMGARCHYQAFVESIRKFYGFDEDISGINYAGKTDPQILREVLKLGGFTEDEIESSFKNCLKYMVQYYINNVYKENIRALIGVNDLLKELKKDKTLLGLVTGNLKPIAYAKLGKAGLDDYFSFGGFGSDSSVRSNLVKKALYLARNEYGYDGVNIFVIGDTPPDVQAAQVYNLKTIAVATGSYSFEELEKCGANFVFEDLSDKDRFLEILNGN